MDWIKTNKATVFICAAFLLGIILFVYASFSTFVSYDAYWHLKMGQDLLGQGLSPRIDHYSFTFPEKPIAAVPYLFQVLLAVFAGVFGLPEAFQLIKLFAFAAFLLALLVYYREIKAPWPIILVTLPYIYLFLLFRFNHVRPEIFDHLLIILALVLYFKGQRSFSHRNLSYIAALQLLWVNYHAPIIGYVIFFGLFLDQAIALLTRRASDFSWLRWAGWGFVIFVIGFMNPDLHHPLVSALAYSNEWAATDELSPTLEILPNSSLFYLFWLISIYLVIALSVQKQYGLALVCCIFAFKSWQSINVVSVSGIVVVALLAFSLARVDFEQLFDKIRPRMRLLIIALAAAMGIAGIMLSASKAVEVNRGSNIDDLPEDIVSYLKEKYPEGGNLFNRMRDGGYLLYHLAPEFKIYIDGRTNILYPAEFFNRYVELYNSRRGESIAGEIERYGIEFAIFPLELAWIPLADASNPLGVEYVSSNFVLFSARENNFPVATRILFFPMCWQPSYQPALAAESAMADRLLPRDSVLVGQLGLLGDLGNSVDAGQFFANLDMGKIASPYHQRLLGFVALKLGFDRQAFSYFESIVQKQTLDLLMMAHAAINQRDYRIAEEILRFSMSEAWQMLNEKALGTRELAIAASLLDDLKREQAISADGAKLLSGLRQALRQSAPTLKLPLASVIPRGRCASLFGESGAGD